MPTGVLHLRALGLEHLVVFVCDLPPATPCLRHGPRVVSRQVVLGHTGIVLPWFACGGVDDGDGAPMDRQGLVTASPEPVMEGAPHRHFREAPMPGVPCTLGLRLVGLPKRQTRLALGMGVRLARPDAVATMLSPERTHGLGARESIAQEGHAMGGHWGGRGAKPALARGAFTVLFGMPVLRQAVRWG